jgi:putative metallohydrolase (TIGR04338 family)
MQRKEPWDSLVAAQAYVDELLTSPWWQRQFPSVRSVVLFDHEGKYALAHKGVHGGAIQLPRWARTPLTLLHELAHLASPPTTIGHGPVYAGIYLLLVQHYMGEGVALQLARHFAARRVRVQPYEGPRHHYFVPRRRGVACQDIAARVCPAPGTQRP